MGGSSCKECLFINESFIIFYFCIDFIESQCYNLQEIKKKKTLMRRVLCGKLPQPQGPAHRPDLVEYHGQLAPILRRGGGLLFLPQAGVFFHPPQPAAPVPDAG